MRGLTARALAARAIARAGVWAGIVCAPGSSPAEATTTSAWSAGLSRRLAAAVSVAAVHHAPLEDPSPIPPRATSCSRRWSRVGPASALPDRPDG